MGAAASFDDRLPAKIDLSTYQKLVGNTKEMIEVFNKLAVDGIITRDVFVENARKRTHVFLTHDWGKDEQGRDNHARVSKVNDWLKANGVITWFDSDRMTGRVVQTMFDGIDNCCVVIVFATRNYIDKVGGKNGDGDNCLKEFNYADMRKTTKNMHVVVNEAGCRNPKTWDGTMGLLAGKLYDDNVEDEKFEDNMQSLLRTIKGMIPPELFVLTTVYGEKAEQEVVMLAPVEAAPLLGLTDEEEEKREEDGMYEWMRQYSPEIPSKKARKTAHAFVKHELTIKKIAQKIKKNMEYLKDNFDLLDDDDIEEFVNGLKQAGLLGGDAAALAPSSPGGVLANSSSAPVVLASAGVGGTTTVAAIDPIEADAIGADLISEFNLCVASLPLIEKYELKAANMNKYQMLAKAQKLEEAKALGIEIKAMGPCAPPDGFSASKDVMLRVLEVRKKIDVRRLALIADISDFENVDRAMVCIEYGMKVDAFIKEKGLLFEGIKEATLSSGSAVFCVTKLSEGRLCSGHENGMIKVWNSSDGVCSTDLKGHTGWVFDVVQLSNGRLVSCGRDKLIKVWDLTADGGKGSCVSTLNGHTGDVWSVYQLLDGRLVSGSGDNSLKVWDLTADGGKGSCVSTLTGHTSIVYSVYQLLDGRVVSGSSDNSLKVWDLTADGGKGSCVSTLTGHTGKVFSVCQLFDGRVVSGSGDNSLIVWK